MAKSDLSIIVVSWNSWSVLRDCLLSLREALETGVSLQVIVVDNASSDGTSEHLAKEFPEFELVAEQKNWGYAKGNNLGLARATGEFILLLNPDTTVPPETLTGVLELAKRRPAYGCVCCRLQGLDGKTQASIRDFPTLANTMFDALGLSRVFRRAKASRYRLPSFDYTKEQPCPQAMGTFLLFRREALEAVSTWPTVFDERFPIFFNDVDLSKRLLDAGFPSLYTPKYHVIHYGGFSTKQVRADMIWESHRSLGKYLDKHRLSRWPFFVKILLNIGALIRAKGYREGFRA